ncbi:hypothetical protein AOLI_G00051830 [Acnodon oligacanthus]
MPITYRHSASGLSSLISYPSPDKSLSKTAYTASPRPEAEKPPISANLLLCAPSQSGSAQTLGLIES